MFEQCIVVKKKPVVEHTAIEQSVRALIINKNMVDIDKLHHERMKAIEEMV